MSKKILLADDSITIQKVIGITFANEDYELTVVDNGADAITKAGEMNPEIGRASCRERVLFAV